MNRSLFRTLSLSSAVALAVVTGLPSMAAGCTTDSPKVTGSLDAGGAPPPATVIDAGAAEDAGAPAPPDDAGGLAVLDAGASGEDASSEAAMTTKGRGTSSGGSTSTGGDTKNSDAAAKAGIYDKILVKPKDPSLGADEVKALVEKKTGLAVAHIRRTAGKWYMVQLAPKSGRDADEQRKLVAELKEVDAFKSVEADRLMQVKTP